MNHPKELYGETFEVMWHVTTGVLQTYRTTVFAPRRLYDVARWFGARRGVVLFILDEAMEDL